ncbi:MAG: serine/threonine-protein kinase [candidate division WOR-3 bacterium]
MNTTGFVTRYRLLETIGAGGMGVVYRDWDRLRCEMVALKQVNLHAERSPVAPHTDTHAFSLSLMQEFRTLASLRHPHIVPVYDFGFYTKQQPFFTMQFLEQAKPITDYVKSCGMEEKLQCLWQALHALWYLHRRHILHRDLKPSNILMNQNRVMLVDFGLSIALGKTGESGGTLGYLAPELLGGDPASISSDLYAFGVVTYELFCGRLPFPITDLVSIRKLFLTRFANKPCEQKPASFLIFCASAWQYFGALPTN